MFVLEKFTFLTLILQYEEKLRKNFYFLSLYFTLFSNQVRIFLVCLISSFYFHKSLIKSFRYQILPNLADVLVGRPHNVRWINFLNVDGYLGVHVGKNNAHHTSKMSPLAKFFHMSTWESACFVPIVIWCCLVAILAELCQIWCQRDQMGKFVKIGGVD